MRSRTVRSLAYIPAGILALGVTVAGVSGQSYASGVPRAGSYTSSVAARASTLPVLDNLGGGDFATWQKPEIRPAVFYLAADGNALVEGMHWAKWTDSTAVTSSATYYARTGHHYDKVTMTLSGAQLGPKGYCGAPDFTRMTITGKGFRTEKYTYRVLCYSGHVTLASWIGGVS